MDLVSLFRISSRCVRPYTSRKTIQVVMFRLQCLVYYLRVYYKLDNERSFQNATRHLHRWLGIISANCVSG